MRTTFYKVMAAAAFVTGASPAFTAPEATVPSRGWFFYEETLEPEVEQTAPLKPPSTSGGASGEGEATFSAAWLRENLPDYQDRALDTGDPKDVELYLYLQQIAIQRASVFRDRVTEVVANNPALNPNANAPQATFGKAVRKKALSQAKNTALTEIAGTGAGVWFFYRSDCPYCDAQAPILERLSNRFGIPVLAIALDGLPLANSALNAVPDTGQGARLGIKVTPTLYLAAPPDNIQMLALGLQSQSSLEERLVEVAYRGDILSPEQYYAATGREGDTVLPPALLDTAIATSNDPATLLDYLRNSDIGHTPTN